MKHSKIVVRIGVFYIKTIGRHINNALKEELSGQNTVVAKFATTASDGKKYMVEHYNLDVIICFGLGWLYGLWHTADEHITGAYGCIPSS